MKERIKRSLISIAGPNTRVIENPKSIEKKRKKIFIDTVNSIKGIKQKHLYKYTTFVKS